MIHFMNRLTDKPGWDSKIFRETIVAKLKAEALVAPHFDMTERMFRYCIDELRYKAKIFQETGFVSAYDGDIVKSDLAIPSYLKDSLRTAAAPLEDVPEVHRDWHPGSNDTDSKHYHCWSRCLCEEVWGGETLRVPSHEEAQAGGTTGLYHYHTVSMQDPYSRKFQWLPCEVAFDGYNPLITSYINNLHPQIHKCLYEAIEQIISLTIPLWNQVLTPLTPLGQRPPRIVYFKCEYDPEPDYWERTGGRERDTRRSRVVRPEPLEFKVPQEDTKKFDLRTEFGKRGIQVIVKLANIHLTPEKPEYEGGMWHVEGQLNEHICATALYYYDNSNITESLLAFRQQSSTKDASHIFYQQDHHEWLSEVFGCEQNGPAVQYIGGVVTKEGRLLAFPNVFQHRVGPFGLVDKTKPGHRNILALFLVDPHIRIISSANVPCQQKEWWAHELQANGGFSTLPNELLKEVVDNVEEFPIGLDEAKELRIELMEERKKFVQRHDVQFEAATFSLCEH